MVRPVGTVPPGRITPTRYWRYPEGNWTAWSLLMPE